MRYNVVVIQVPHILCLTNVDVIVATSVNHYLSFAHSNVSMENASTITMMHSSSNIYFCDASQVAPADSPLFFKALYAVVVGGG